MSRSFEQMAHRASQTKIEFHKLHGQYLFDQLVKEGELINSCLNLDGQQLAKYLEAHTEIIRSADRQQEVQIIWGPNSQVISRVVRHKGKRTVLTSWKRKAFTKAHKDILRKEINTLVAR